jgi:4-alpha-glucanotransferase
VGERVVVAPAATVTAVLEAMGAAGRAPAPAPVVVVRAGTSTRLKDARAVVTEDGGKVALKGERVPGNLPWGYHRVVRADGTDAPLIVSPGSCRVPRDLRTWAWTVQLYAMRSRRSWGMGDLGDLRRALEWARGLGAKMLMINPLHAVAPGVPQQPSPYYPSSRLWRNPIYLRLDDVPGADGSECTEVAAAARALNSVRVIDRDAVWSLKMKVLENVWRRRRADETGFVRFRARHGALLEAFGIYCALTETLGRDWRRWPEAYRRPGAAGVARFRAERAERVSFHMWLQWLLDEQLAAASSAGGLIQDLAVGSDPGGADAWLWQDLVAPGIRVGAPPDQFNAHGQDWGIAAFDPWKLRAAAYEPFVHMLRHALARDGGVRIDHVMGLWRLFWIPADATPAQGVYVRYPVRELLDIVALESRRAGAVVIGEDLGTVEAGVRRTLAARRMLSYRLLWFEPRNPARLPKLSLAAVTNHDLATAWGLLSGDDLAAQRALGLDPDEAAQEAIRRRVLRRAGLTGAESPPDAIRALYASLARAPSAILGAMLEDALEVAERPNFPGTTDEWPNWCLALPLALEDVERDARVLALARMLDERQP